MSSEVPTVVHETIDSIPEEVMLEIFKYFDGHSLKVLFFVCKK